jgi:hypothetical protein
MQTMQKKKKKKKKEKKEKTDPKEIKNLICFINSQDLKATTLFQKIEPFERKRERGNGEARGERDLKERMRLERRGSKRRKKP